MVKKKEVRKRVKTEGFKSTLLSEEVRSYLQSKGSKNETYDEILRRELGLKQ